MIGQADQDSATCTGLRRPAGLAVGGRPGGPSRRHQRRRHAVPADRRARRRPVRRAVPAEDRHRHAQRPPPGHLRRRPRHRRHQLPAQRPDHDLRYGRHARPDGGRLRQAARGQPGGGPRRPARPPRRHRHQPQRRRHGDLHRLLPGDRPGLLDGGVRRRPLRLRRRQVRRVGREPGRSTSRSWPWPRHRRGSATGWWRPTAASSTTATPPSSAPPAASTLAKPIVSMAPTPIGPGLLAGGVRRWGVQLRRRPLLRRHQPAHAVEAHREHRGHARPGGATGWWRPTAASSPSATPASSAPPATSC